MRLMVIILTKNESEHIVECIESVRFADDILVFDSFSADDTVTKAQAAGVRVIQHAFENYANQRNAALKAAEGNADWVLFVDADERVTPELAKEVREVIQQSEYVGWNIPRHNYIFGKLTRWAGWYPDYQMRLLKIGSARYDPTRQVHEVVILDGKGSATKNHFLHHNYRDLTQFMRKQRSYSAYEAKILYEGGIRPKFRNYILQPLRHFKWRYITLQGYRDGFHGLRLSMLMSWYELRKYLQLRQLWQQKS